MEFNELIDTIKEYSTAALDKASELGKLAASKTDTAVKKAKIKYGIAELENKRTDVFEAIGKKMYENYKESGNDNGFEEEYKNLDELTDELEELEAKLADYKDTIKCDTCGNYTDSENEFCPKCGAKIDKPQTDDDADDDETVIEVETASAQSDGDDID